MLALTVRSRTPGVPFEVARTSVLIARACQALNDQEGARLELEDARDTFAQLGASADVAVVEALLAGATYSQGLTPRELEVLTLVVAGSTNRRIAEQLFLSERTVHRHLSNVFHKLGVGSRTQAAPTPSSTSLVCGESTSMSIEDGRSDARSSS